MYKLLIGLGLINLAFQFPLLTALTLVGIFLYDNLTKQDIEKIMSIYSNSKEFSKYLTNRAKELNVTLKELRKQVVLDLEVPESKTAPVYSEAFDQPSPNFYENLPDFSEYLTYEELDQFSSNVPLIEKVAAVVKEGLYQPELVWHGDNLTLNDYIGDTPDIAKSRKERYENYFNLKLDYDKPMTSKYFRQVSSKFKAVGKNNLNEIIDQEKYDRAQNILDEIDYFFRHGKLKPFIF
jgi:hypothetical protein